MPITPTYPGVYIEELPSSSHTILAAPTSITAFVGYTHPLKTPQPTAVPAPPRPRSRSTASPITRTTSEGSSTARGFPITSARPFTSSSSTVARAPM